MSLTLDEAFALIEAAPQGDAPSRLNPSLTLSQGRQIILNALQEQRRQGRMTVDGIMEKRVYQIARNQRRPRYKR